MLRALSLIVTIGPSHLHLLRESAQDPAAQHGGGTWPGGDGFTWEGVVGMTRTMRVAGEDSRGPASLHSRHEPSMCVSLDGWLSFQGRSHCDTWGPQPVHPTTELTLR